MRNKFKLILLTILLLLPMSAKADSIYNVNMDISIDKTGTASIKETWTVQADSGSEWYKTMYDLGESSLTNYEVTMDGEKLTYKDWDVNESMSEKAGYYGINNTSNGIELCFGKSDYSSHTFVLTYNLTNYIFNTDDSQVLYWTLLPKVTCQHFSVNVRSYYEFPDTLDVWGYGYKGYSYVKDGIIQMSDENGVSDEYVVLLAKFPKDTFDTNYKVSGYDTFDDVLTIAKQGSYKQDYSNGNLFDDIDVLLNLLWIFIAFICISRSIQPKYGYKDNKKITKDNSPMFRDIPCNKDIYYANALVYLNDFSSKKSNTNILGAIILKWVREKKIGFKNEQKGVFNKETSVLDLTMNPTFDNESERSLFSMMSKASKDGYLESKEMEKWCRKHYSEFLKLFDKINDSYVNKLKSENHIYTRSSKSECKYKNVMDDDIYNESKKLFGLKLYLQEFARMDTKEVMEVHLWDEYLMFAYLFGIADKVAKQLKNMYPEVIEQEDFNYDTFVFINSISTTGVYAASAARSAAQNYSGGGGGFSSGGGGGGSFGGGGSMGGR